MLKKIILSMLLVLTFTTIVLADVIGPDGIVREYYGSKEFQVEETRVDLRNPDVVILKMVTIYPLDKVTYNIADRQFKVNEKDTIAIKMKGEDKGKILFNPEWKDTKQVFGGIKEYCRDAITGEYIKVEASGGKVIGKAMIIKKQLPNKKWEITIIISKRILEGMNITAEFTTAMCGNSFTTEEFYVPKIDRPAPPMPYTIDPSFTNNNPVVPYWTGVPYYGFGYYPGFWGAGYYDPFWEGGGGGGNNPTPSPTPISNSSILVISGIIFIILKNRFHS